METWLRIINVTSPDARLGASEAPGDSCSLCSVQKFNLYIPKISFQYEYESNGSTVFHTSNLAGTYAGRIVHVHA